MSFDDKAEASNRYDRKLVPGDLDPNTSYAKILKLAGDATTVLDVGCNTGYLGNLFIDRGAAVAGIDNDESAVEKAREAGIDAHLADLDLTPIESLFPGRCFDLIIFADVLEHLKHPDRILAGARSMVAPDGMVIASIPNVAHGNVRLDLLLGRFEYTALGLLDNTHLRFFTAEAIQHLFTGAGFSIETVERVTSPVDSRRIEEAAHALDLPVGAPSLLRILSESSSETFQYIVKALPSPSPSSAGERDDAFWTLGDRHPEVQNTPSYLCVDVVPNVIADMRQAITSLEASLDETRQYLATVIRDKDDVINGLEASLAETRAYLENVVHQRAGLVAEAQSDRGRVQFELDRVQTELQQARTELKRVRRNYEGLTLPTVTVVVVNWNGEALLPACLTSLQNQDYPVDRFRIVVVDNGSTDDSVGCIRRDFPGVTVLPAGRNLGFAGGNNLAISSTDGDYLALLNNDAVAEGDWLRRLVEVAESDPTIAAVNAKIMLMEDRLPVTVDVDDAFVPGPHDPRRLSAQFSHLATVGGAPVGIEFISGAFGLEQSVHGPFWWITTQAEFRVPMAAGETSEVILTVLPTKFPNGRQPAIRFRVGETVVAAAEVPANETLEVRIPVTSDRVVPLIQNAGSVVLPDGSGRDRGTIVREGVAFYDTDHGQFDTVEDVPAFCGAAALLRRSALQQVGAFDESFFMYYEDTDLSLRLRRHGWRLVYTPHARARHHHSATAVEWSPRFCYFTERNRLLMLAKDCPPGVFLREWARYTARLACLGEPLENRKRFMRVQRSLLRRSPGIISARLQARRRKSAPPVPIGFREVRTPSDEAGGEPR